LYNLDAMGHVKQSSLYYYSINLKDKFYKLNASASWWSLGCGYIGLNATKW
jgi:hypothetical protein